MKRTVASTLVVCVVLIGIPARAISAPAAVATTYVTSGVPTETAQQSESAAQWKARAQQRLGKKVKIALTTGEAVKGVLRSVSDTGVTVEVQTKDPVPLRDVAYGDIHEFEGQGMHWIAKTAIIAGAVVGAILIGWAFVYASAD
jgi:hypothetical protein